jgi:hypothetical protein
VNQRENDKLVVDRTAAFEERLADYFKNWEGERGQQWQDEDETEEGIPLEQATQPQQLPNNLG